MPINTAALKTFAPAMRRQLLEAVGRKLDLLLHSQTPDTLSTYAKQISELREQEAENREQLLERVAYTWFNRLCALRYLDAKGWHPFGCKVLMPAAEGETQPELLKLMRAGSLPAELKAHTNEARLHGLLDGQIPPAIAGADPQGEVYRELVLASCRSYHQLLPELFEGLDDASELLLPDDLLSEGSIAGNFRSSISDEDCEDVEIIGWLYQFYISEKKDQVIGKVVKSEDIPAATQLFTPNWIVKYMVQNSLGATWLATYPDSPLKGQMEFYIEPAEQSPEVQAQLAAITPESLDPEALTLIDPACGSGHILVEAYDLLKSIYLERGYRQRDIPELILTKNLYGLDICPRAAQLTAFSLLMKGREDDRRLLERGIQLNVMALQDSTGLNVEGLAATVDLAVAAVSRADVRMLAELFAHATTFGSLIQVPTLLADKLPALSRLAQQVSQDLLDRNSLQLLGALVRQAEILARRYDAVVANPPYMGSGGMNKDIKDFAKDKFPNGRSDLFACFMIRGQSLAKAAGQATFVTLDSWMFLATYEKMRHSMLTCSSISSLVHIGWNCFPQGHLYNRGVAFTLAHGNPPLVAKYLDLSNVPATTDKHSLFLERIKSRQDLHQRAAHDFMSLPGSPLSYWISNKIRDAFGTFAPIGSHFFSDGLTKTGNNERFLRYQWEVGHEKAKDLECYRICVKGGAARSYFGNTEILVNWSNSARAHYRTDNVARITPEYLWSSSGISWTKVSSNGPTFRWFGDGMIAETGGPSIFAGADCDDTLFWHTLAFLTSTVSWNILASINPTINVQTSDILSLPLSRKHEEITSRNARSIFVHVKDDWDTFEHSLDYKSSPLLPASTNSSPAIESAYATWINNNKQVIAEVKILEEEKNRLFIEAYGLQADLTAAVPIEQITLTINPAYRYGRSASETEQWNRFGRDTMAEFLSYATGCMMGRYSLNQPGLILADSRASQDEQLAAYEEKVGKPLSEVQFKPDPDGIIPVLDGEWFEDDIVARTREFLAVTFPESSVAENLRFIEDALGKDIRKYFCTEFYKDHLQTYKKRPIYWMVQSPRKGFACLIYLHRYTKDTLNQVLNNYFRPYLQKLEARLAQLGLDQLNDDLPARERTAARKEAEKITKVLKECQAWEQDALLPLAQQRIELDLDDGVKVNYLKLQDVLAPIPGLAAKED